MTILGRAGSLCSALVLATLTTPARADDPSAPAPSTGVVYEVAPTLPCLDAERLAARVAPMLDPGRRRGSAEDRLVVEGDPTRVAVRVLRDGADAGAREVSRPGGICDDALVGTVAVIAATLLMPADTAAPVSPSAPATHAGQVSPSRAPEPPPSAPTDPVSADPVAEPQTAAPPASSSDSGLASAPTVEPARDDAEQLWLGASGGAVLAIGMLPDPSFGLDLHAHVGAAGGVSGRVGVTVLPSARVDAIPGAELTYASLDARICAPMLLDLSPLRLLACAGPSVGLVRAIGTNVAVARERFEIVVDVAASVGAVFAVTSDVALGVEIGGRALLVRPRFYVESEPTRLVVHTPNEVVPWLSLTLFVGDPRPSSSRSTPPPQPAQTPSP